MPEEKFRRPKLTRRLLRNDPNMVELENKQWRFPKRSIGQWDKEKLNLRDIS